MDEYNVEVSLKVGYKGSARAAGCLEIVDLIANCNLFTYNPINCFIVLYKCQTIRHINKEKVSGENR